MNALAPANQPPVVPFFRRALTNLGCQTIGTVIVRPSESSAVKASSVTMMSVASGTVTLIVETCIPLIP